MSRLTMLMKAEQQEYEYPLTLSVEAKLSQLKVFYAGIISLGCNIGIPKMSQISSGINQNNMVNTVNWYFNINNLKAANERICMFINRLVLPHVFAEDDSERYGSSDGRKVGVAVDCLLATYSFKYFGKDKGISIYTFIDDRNVLFHHQVMSSTEREAAYVIPPVRHEVAKESCSRFLSCTQRTTHATG